MWTQHSEIGVGSLNIFQFSVMELKEINMALFALSLVLMAALSSASPSQSFLDSNCPNLCTSDDGRDLCAVRYNPFKSGPAPTTKFPNTCALIVYNCKNPTAPLVLLNYGACK